MLKHHCDFFTFTWTLDRSCRTLADLLQGPMWNLPAVLLLDQPLNHLIPYFKGRHGDGDLLNAATWHDGNRSYSPNDIFELHALSVAAVRVNGGIPEAIPERLLADVDFQAMNVRSRVALATIHWLLQTFSDWMKHPVGPNSDVVYLPSELSYEEDWPFSSPPDQEDIDAGGSWGEYEWVDDFRRKHFWWSTLRMNEWNSTNHGRHS